MQLALPVQNSFRFGSFIEVNPLGDQKLCSYDCPYCFLGPTEVRMNQIKKSIVFPSVEEIEKALRAEITAAVSGEIAVDTILVSGNGEPTLHPELDRLAERLKFTKQEAMLSAKLIVLTNGAHIDSRRAVEALNLFDERVIKIDAGSESGYKSVNAPLTRGNLSKVTSGARKLNDCIVQSLFFNGPGSNLDPDEIDEWMEVVGIVKPKMIQIHTINRQQTARPDISPATEDELYTVVSKFKRKSNTDIKVFYDPDVDII